ncbi:Uu.00g090230.m01.CDS01 [Anthostomella pinea]|uniref:Uu.00g090230.m01.CDS01 n=1 Tax=Anthostomella pinea TaxID=933095 RepID=A0AAI8VNH0_9PEZI|nr:Uu.00g090230.m01.CDS01 [Anthostomella pinea]
MAQAEPQDTATSIVFSNDAQDKRATNLAWQVLPKTIHDVRGHVSSFSLDANEFAFRNHHSVLGDFLDISKDVVTSKYLPDVENISTEELGTVDKVFFFDWRVQQFTNNGLITLG